MDRSNAKDWVLFGRIIPKAEVIFISQVVMVYIIICVSLFNLSMGNTNQVWLVLLSSCVGYLLPPPQLERSYISTIPNANNNWSLDEVDEPNQLINSETTPNLTTDVLTGFSAIQLCCSKCRRDKTGGDCSGTELSEEE